LTSISFTDLLDGFHLIHGLILVVVGVFNFWFWAKKGFWVPKYVHILAAIALIISVVLGWLAFSQGYIKDPPAAIRVWIMTMILMPSIVYFFFVFYGGVKAACRNGTVDNKRNNDNGQMK
jgi:uncharacterized membrane protein